MVGGGVITGNSTTTPPFKPGLSSAGESVADVHRPHDRGGADGLQGGRHRRARTAVQPCNSLERINRSPIQWGITRARAPRCAARSDAPPSHAIRKHFADKSPALTPYLYLPVDSNVPSWEDLGYIGYQVRFMVAAGSSLTVPLAVSSRRTGKIALSERRRRVSPQSRVDKCPARRG